MNAPVKSATAVRSDIKHLGKPDLKKGLGNQQRNRPDPNKDPIASNPKTLQGTTDNSKFLKHSHNIVTGVSAALSGVTSTALGALKVASKDRGLAARFGVAASDTSRIAKKYQGDGSLIAAGATAALSLVANGSKNWKEITAPNISTQKEGWKKTLYSTGRDTLIAGATTYVASKLGGGIGGVVGRTNLLVGSVAGIYIGSVLGAHGSKLGANTFDQYAGPYFFKGD